MILAPAVPYVPLTPLTPLTALEAACFPLGSTRRRAQWAQPPQAAWLEPDPAQLDPGVARHPLEMREGVGAVDVGDAQTSDVDRDCDSPAREELLCRLEHVVACPTTKRPCALERRRSEGQLQHRGASVDVADMLHQHYLRHR